MEVSASSEDALQLSSRRKTGTSAPVFVFSSMHKLYKRTLFLFFSMGAHWIWFTASFHDVHCASVGRALRHMRRIVHIIFMHVHKCSKQHYDFRTDKSATDKNNLSYILRNPQTRNPEYKITANHILQIYYYYYYLVKTHKE